MSGTLYIVATPIGNLEDITFRALKTLKEVDYILSEDTRKTSILLSRFDINTHALSYHQQSAFEKKQEIAAMLISNKNLALVTDAGTPGISDPGNELIDFLLSQIPDLKIIPVPGASSVTAALSASGFNTSNFLFIGFWPKKKTKKLFERIKLINCPIVFFESPFRIQKTIDLLIKEFGENKRIFLGQEMTKIHERVLRGTLLDIKTKLEIEEKELGRVKGEIVLILEF